MSKKNMKQFTLYVLLAFLLTVSCTYNRKITATHIRLSPVYTSGMVLQTTPHTEISGYASPDGVLAVRIGEYVRMAKADAKGHWNVSFPEIKTRNPFNIRIEGVDATIMLNDVIPGKVFIIGGDADLSAFDAIDNKAIPLPRSFSSDKQQIKVFFMDNGQGRWYPYEKLKTKPEVNADLVALASRIKSADSPIGIICLSRPATNLISWLNPGSKLLTELNPQRDTTLPPFLLNDKKLVDSVVTLSQSSRMGLEKRIGRIWYRDDSWKTTGMPTHLVPNGALKNKRIAYLRRKILVPSRKITSDFKIDLGIVSGKVEYFFNENQVSPMKNSERTILSIPDSLIFPNSNVLLIRFFREDSLSRFYSEATIYNADSSFYEVLNKGWKYDLDFEPDFPQYCVWQTRPSALFESYISDYTDIAAEAVFWYDSYQEGSYPTTLMTPEILGYFNTKNKYILYRDFSATDSILRPEVSKTRQNDLKTAAVKAEAWLDRLN